MSNCVLILGPSGTGKSTSIRNLDPKSTFIISILNKPLPFRGYKKLYIHLKSWDDLDGNYYCSDDWVKVLKCIQIVNQKRPEIKTLIIDDFQYLLANEFMRRASEKGFDRFTDIAQHAWSVIKDLSETRPDLYCFVISHSEQDQFGNMKCKTIGKLLDDKITIEGMFTVCLFSTISDEGFRLLTQHDGIRTAKSPMGMFKEKYIDNDLKVIQDLMTSYFEEE